MTILSMFNQKITLSQSEIISLGASLRQIEQKVLKQKLNEGKLKIWFQGEEPYFDVLFELQNNEILWFEFTLRGKSLSWDRRKDKLQTGTTNELSINDASFYAASKTIDNDMQIDWDFIQLVKSILETRADEEIFAKALVLFD
ncbi:hypothetical protein [Nostoc sp. CENA543]|uniref:hypothetical protein n=1 Tax=Nostoc sp. CENA543 TaxID=1869241 RepID=UPI001CEF795A|nr:hypothetical protein [Nostoc sp. CENA543]